MHSPVMAQAVEQATDGWNASDERPAALPPGVSVDSNGDLLIGTGLTGVLLVSSSSDDIEAIAGNRTFGYSGDEAPGAAAQFRSNVSRLGCK